MTILTTQIHPEHWDISEDDIGNKSVLCILEHDRNGIDAACCSLKLSQSNATRIIKRLIDQALLNIHLINNCSV